jgi:hypothetical protein
MRRRPPSDIRSPIFRRLESRALTHIVRRASRATSNDNDVRFNRPTSRQLRAIRISPNINVNAQKAMRPVVTAPGSAGSTSTTAPAEADFTTSGIDGASA